MTNHYHAVVETPDANLARGMRQLNGIYTQYVNRRYQRVGHVFQGRYRGILVEKDSYLLELARYVVLNPVRAGMVADARKWHWSSYRAMIGEAAVTPWLETDWILSQFGSQRRGAIARYIDFVRAGVNMPGLWTQLRSQIYLGSERFVTRMQKHVTTTAGLAEVPRAQRRPVAKGLAYYQRKWADPRRGMALAYASGNYTMKAIADHFGVHYSTVSRAVKDREISQ
jgi:succinate dehydrogenase flavin-adding protein (antitoxin of CptAB toxin-antitoxin module)